VHGFINERKAYINSVRGTNRELLFFRKNFRKNFDDVIFMLNKGIDKNRDIGDISRAKKGVLGNPDLYNLIGNNLAPGTSGKGGRRKTRRSRKTRKTRKNKRKSTRRTGRKYKK